MLLCFNGNNSKKKVMFWKKSPMSLLWKSVSPWESQRKLQDRARCLKQQDVFLPLLTSIDLGGGGV